MKIPFFLVIFNLHIINSFLLAKKKKWLGFDSNVDFFFHASLHSTSVLTLPFNHFLCDCLASSSLYFVRLNCNVLRACIGRPMQLVSSEASFRLKWERKAGEVCGGERQEVENGGRREEKPHLYF